MKKFFTFQILVILSLFAFFSCSNLLNESTEADNNSKAYISIALDSERTILPEAHAKEDLSYELWGQPKDGKEIKLYTWVSYSDISNYNSLEVTAGKWTFTLKAFKENTQVLEDTIEHNVTYGKNYLSFNLKEFTGTGAIELKLWFPAKNSGKVVITMTSDDSSLNTSYSKSFTPEDFSDSKTENDIAYSAVTFKEKNIPSGYYTVNVAVYQNDGEAAKITYSLFVKICSGSTSKSEETIKDGNYVTIYKDGDKILWNAIPDVSTYYVYYYSSDINDNNGVFDTSLFEKKKYVYNETSYDISSFSYYDYKSYKDYLYVAVKANGYESDFSNVIKILPKKLALNYSYADSVSKITWESVSGVSSYKVYKKADNDLLSVNNEYTMTLVSGGDSVDVGNVTEYDVTADIAADKYTYFAVYSDKTGFSEIVRISPAKVPVIDYSDSKITWDSITDALSYSVYKYSSKENLPVEGLEGFFNTGNFKDALETQTSTKFSISETSSVMYEYYAVKANFENDESSRYSNVIKIVPKPVISYSDSDSKITWEKIKGLSYVLYSYESSENLDTNTFDITKMTKASLPTQSCCITLPNSNSNKIRYYAVKTTDSNEEFTVSNVIKVYFPAPVISQSGSSITWDIINDATTYKVYSYKTDNDLSEDDFDTGLFDDYPYTTSNNSYSLSSSYYMYTYYAVKAVYDNGNTSGFSNVIKTFTGEAPYINYSSNKIDWDNYNSYDSFDVYSYTSESNLESSNVDTSLMSPEENVTTCSYAIAENKSNNYIYYAIKGKLNGYETDFSNIIKICPTPVLTLTGSKLSWNCDSVKLYSYSSNENIDVSNFDISELNYQDEISESTYDLSSRYMNAKYAYYAVMNSDGYSSFSNIIKVFKAPYISKLLNSIRWDSDDAADSYEVWSYSSKRRINVSYFDTSLLTKKASISKDVHEYAVTPNSFEYQYYAIKTIINGESSLMSYVYEIVNSIADIVPFVDDFENGSPIVKALMLPYESGASYKIYKYETSANFDETYMDTSLLSYVETVSNLEYYSDINKCEYKIHLSDKYQYYAYSLVFESKESILSHVYKISPNNQ
ncbi:hypothetical protein MSI_13780 [Treponema sp. JC4]|uniref:hypothetical protein n=1 Tax=Treponema sp. JC4 TaxID=1124982 RepID=UPI00025AFBF5|nr:hypothetical protein [Treponema sp. JC4]EID85121.1 hypothetical protein MSI_13780 [Treponema sp. JC4]